MAIFFSFFYRGNGKGRARRGSHIGINEESQMSKFPRFLSVLDDVDARARAGCISTGGNRGE